jgi:hypothetical protein
VTQRAKSWGRSAAVACCALLLARPGLAFADVVPARKAKADRDAVAVEQRLSTLGVDSTTAKSSAERLTPSELRFFAEDPSRVQAVCGLTGGEWLGGGIFLGLMGFLYFGFVSNQN